MSDKNPQNILGILYYLAIYTKLNNITKSNHFFGQPMFSKMINLINATTIEKIADEHKINHYYKKFNTFQNL